MPHSDPNKQAEHTALLDLLPIGDEDVTAVSNGSWFSSSTWNTGNIPSTGQDVRIPDGVTVTYDGVSNDRIGVIRVDGKLAFDTSVDSKLIVDSLLTMMGSELEIGTESNPISANNTVEIIIAPVTPFDPANPGDTAIDTTWDWHQLSRGVVTHGKTRVHGAAKTSFVRVSADPVVGDTSISLDSAPSGWLVGDTVVITGTQHYPDSRVNGEWVWNGSEDEVREITAISGSTITLDAALDYSHTGISYTDLLGEPMRAYVANTTRNVRFSTENPATTPIQQRGHVMFMHNPDVDVRFAEFQELGRSDKSIPFDDFETDSNGRIYDENGDPVIGPRTNVRGRYSLHVHRVGAADPNGTPAMIKGCSVVGGPGWGFVHHDSFAIFEACVSFDVFAAHYVAETGNEIGTWRDNIAIRSAAQGHGNTHGVKNGKRLYHNHDIARTGTGYWYQGRVCGNENNVAAGHRGSAHAYFLRGEDQINVATAALEFPEIARGEAFIGPATPEIHDHHDNEVFASRAAFTVVKSGADQGHAARSLIRNLTAWNVQYGSHNQYTSRYTFSNMTVVGSPNGASLAMDLFQSVFDMVFDNVRIEDFNVGFHYKDQLVNFPAWAEEDIVLIDVDFGNVGTDIEHENNNIQEIQIYDSANLPNNALSFDAPTPVIDANDKLVLSGTIYDSVGDMPHEVGAGKGSLKTLAASVGYYSLGSQDVMPWDEVIMDRTTGEAVIYTYLVDVTGINFIYNSGSYMGDWLSASDGFESGGFSGGSGWAASDWTLSGSRLPEISSGEHNLTPSTGTFMANLDGRAELTRTVDLSGVSTATLQFDWAIYSMDSAGEELVCEVNDGSGWVEEAALSYGDAEREWFLEQVDLSGYVGISNLQIRFRNRAGGGFDKGYVDNVTVSP